MAVEIRKPFASYRNGLVGIADEFPCERHQLLRHSARDAELLTGERGDSRAPTMNAAAHLKFASDGVVFTIVPESSDPI
jgi:hypothetical protein